MDGWLFRFRTQGFIDDPQAVAQRVNDNIGGDALARWLSAALRQSGVEASEPWPEDHGCDFSIARDGKTYLCVCHIEEEGEAKREAGVFLSQSRSLKDRLTGAHKFTPDDPLAALTHDLLAAHPDVTELSRE